ncbi:MAG TPA: glucose-6-phosphate dehydrogenase [Bacillota bacterium]|nr:glucose-6-phosphate dehydrogenase [Bacillota bacterium]
MDYKDQSSREQKHCIMVVFGGTGDLTQRKLIPALYQLKYQGLIPDNFAVVAVGRRQKTDEEYRDELLNSVRQFSRFELVESVWNELASAIYYQRLNFLDWEGYHVLKDFLDQIDKSRHTSGNRIFYLAIAPGNYESVINNLSLNGMVKNTSSWQRVVIEKPFGTDLESAQSLNQTIAAVFPEENTFRIDHYLGKEMVQSILGIRFANSLFEPLWNHQYIDNIQISASEIIGIENRGEYYEKSGAIRDMVQNHLLQILALVAMEAPVNLQSDSIRDEKIKFLRSVRGLSPALEEQNIILGQYSNGILGGAEVAGFRQELKVAPDSDTETFVALKLQSNNPRWQGPGQGGASIPFYLRTGKRLATKSTTITVQFKSPLNVAFQNGSQDFAPLVAQPNLLVIQIQPQEKISIRFNTKEPGVHGKICPVKMSFCQKCKICEANTNSPEAYEKLLLDVFANDSTLFTRWDEVEESWKLVENIAVGKRKTNPIFPNYAPGSWGPQEADKLLARDHRHWWNIEKKIHDKF